MSLEPAAVQAAALQPHPQEIQMPFYWNILVLVVFAAMSLNCSANPVSTESSEAINKFSAVVNGSQREMSSRQVARGVTHAYSELISSWIDRDRLRALPSAEVEAFFEAANDASFYTNSPRHAEDMRVIFSALEARGLGTDERRRVLREGYVRARMFDAARKIVYPGAEPLPEVLELPTDRLPGPTAYTVSKTGRTVEQQVLPFSDGIVVISHPNCGFSNAAIRAIEDDSELRGLFSGSVFWLAPIDGDLYFDTLRKWNMEHPMATMAIGSNMEEWSQIEDWSTPTFYFFRNGSVAATVVGWPKGGNKVAILDAARTAGLLSEP